MADFYHRCAFLIVGTVCVLVAPCRRANQIAKEELIPVVIGTWAQSSFPMAVQEAWRVLQQSDDRLAAVVAGCRACQRLQCDGSVGFGGSPDESGETTLGAMIMDGPTHDMGGVGGLRRVKDAIGVAHAVMLYSKHSILVGDSATKFALEMGFPEENLTTAHSIEMWQRWRNNNCQPNFRINVMPNPLTSCGPYTPAPSRRKAAGEQEIGLGWSAREAQNNVNPSNHDTIGMVVIDKRGDMAIGTSTNGATFKVAGRLSDAPLPGAGAYVDNEIGGAAATGDGDVMMRFVPSYQTVENMRLGMSPDNAAADAVRRISKYYPHFQGALIAADKRGRHAIRCCVTWEDALEMAPVLRCSYPMQHSWCFVCRSKSGCKFSSQDVNFLGSDGISFSDKSADWAKPDCNWFNHSVAGIVIINGFLCLCNDKDYCNSESNFWPAGYSVRIAGPNDGYPYKHSSGPTVQRSTSDSTRRPKSSWNQVLAIIISSTLVLLMAGFFCIFAHQFIC